jgi:hypothetical protein
MATADIHLFITLQAIDRGDFGGRRALELNNIAELVGSEPEYLAAFRANLKLRRSITPQTGKSFLHRMRLQLFIIVAEVCGLQKLVEAFANYFEIEEMPDDGTRDRWANNNELWHLAGAFRNEGWKLSKVIKENNVRWHFEQLALYFESIFDSGKHGL